MYYLLSSYVTKFKEYLWCHFRANRKKKKKEEKSIQ